jgi:WD40 repeat protein
MLISTGGSVVALWNISTGELLQTYTCNDVRLFATVLVSDEMLATGGSGGLIWLFDRKTGFFFLLFCLEDILTNRQVNLSPP